MRPVKTKTQMIAEGELAHLLIVNIMIIAGMKQTQVKK
jgi:hypothetical protein